MKPLLCNNRSCIITDVESLSFFHPKKYKPAEKFLRGVIEKTFIISQKNIPSINFSNN